VRPTDDGTLVSAATAPVTPATAAEQQAAPVGLAPGRHLAVALIPRGGPTEEQPAIFLVEGRDGEKPKVIVSDEAPATRGAPTLDGGGEPSAPTPAVPAAAFPFELPDPPGPNDSQALAVNRTDGGTVYDIAYSLVTVTGGAEVDSTNAAYAFANCKGCTTVAVSFQVVLVVGRSDTIAPINVAQALNGNCPACVTVAIAHQIVLSLESMPSDELLQRLRAELQKLDAIEALGPHPSPADVADHVDAAHEAVERALEENGLAVRTPTATPSPAASPSPSPEATPTPQPESTATPTPMPSPSPSPTATPTPTVTPSPTAEEPTPTAMP
jgi:putative peptide zinc metalloprotease protein